MDRRRFLRFLGGTAVGGAGLGAWTTDKLGRIGGPLSDDDLRHNATVRAASAIGTRRLVWSGETDEPVVALTFDDGPYPWFTEHILRTLDRYGVRATFNFMGVNAVSYPDLVAEVVSRGHEIGNHTMSHVRLPTQTPKETQQQIAQAKEAIEAVAGVPVRFFRPPWGQLTGAAARHAAAVGHDVLLWSITRQVPGVGTAREVADNLLEQLHPGAIVLLHDGFIPGTFDVMTERLETLRKRRETEVAAVAPFLEGALGRGYRFVTASGLVDGDAVVEGLT